MRHRLTAIAALLLFVGVPAGELAGLFDLFRIHVPLVLLAVAVVTFAVILAISYRTRPALDSNARKR